MNFEVETPVDFVKKMNGTGSLGYFNFDIYAGYPIEIRTNDMTRETQDYQMLVKAGTDLSPLIRK
jgi:hypothetical protein